MNKILRTSFLFCSFLLLAGIARAQVAGFSWTPTSSCAPQVLYFTDNSTGTITKYTWDFGNGNTSTLKSPSVSYTTPGTYTVKLTVTGPGGSNTKTVSIVINPPPTVSFTYTPTAGCAPLSVNFTSAVTANASGGVTYQWDFGDGVTGNTANPSHTYTKGGTYSVSVTVTNSNGCTKTVLLNNIITVYAKPIASFVAFPSAACSVPALVSFTNATSGTGPFTISWDFGDGSTTSGVASPTHTYTSSGSFVVKQFVVDSRGCKDTLVQTITTHANAANFSGPTDVCEDIANTYTNTTSGATTATTYWDFGDGTSEVAAAVTHTYANTGSYTLMMVTKVGSCSDTVRKVITVNPTPTVSFTPSVYAPFANCNAPATFNYVATGAASYTWLHADGSTGTGANHSKTYTTDGFRDSVRVIGITSAGCIDTTTIEVPVYHGTVSIMGRVRGCVPLTETYTAMLNFIPSSPSYPSGIAAYSWSWGDGSPNSTTNSATHTYTQVGVYARIFTVTLANGCVLTRLDSIYVGTPIKPSFTFPPVSVCVKTPVYFTNTTPRAANPPVVTYTWNVGQGYTEINNRDAVTNFIIPGTYDIILYADSNGCVDSAICEDCLTILPGNANFLDSVYCSPSNRTVKFLDRSIGATSYLWDFGDGSTSTATTGPTHTYTQDGTYRVRLTTYNSVSGCRDTMDNMVSVMIPTLSFLAQDTSLCERDTLKLTPYFNGKPGKWEFQWVIDDTTRRNDSLLRPANFVMEKYSTPYELGLKSPVVGYHTVTLIVRTSNGIAGHCIDSLRKPNYFIVSHPTPGFYGSPVIGCTPFPVLFTDTSKYTPGTARGSLAWTFGDGNTGTTTSQTITNTYMAAGKYDVKMIVSDFNGCKDSIIKKAYVEARHPKADFKSSTNGLVGCIGDPITFTDLSTGATRLKYFWTFGDGDTSTAANPTHRYSIKGSFTVRLVVTDSTGCTDTMTKSAYTQITKPTAGFSLSDTLSICPPLIVNFTSSSLNTTSYSWEFGNSGSSGIQNPSSTFSTPGVYTIRLIAYDAAGCPDTAKATVRVLGYSGALSYDAASGCAPLTVNFKANITNIPSMVWDFSDGTTMLANGLTASHTYLSPGAYVPKLIFSDSTKCKSSSTGLDTIKVDDIIGGFKVLPPCEKSPVQFIDTSYSYFSSLTSSRWDFGPLGIVTGNPITRTYPVAGTYSVTLLSINGNGCRDTLTKTFTIFPLPVIKAMDDTAVCMPDAISLTATGGMMYTWSPGATLSCTSCDKPLASPTVPTSYVVVGVDANGCAGKDTVRVNIQTKTTFTTVQGGEICLGKTYQLSAGGATVYNWTPSSSLNDPGIANPIAKPTVNTTYIVTAKEGSCLTDTHSVQVIVRPVPTVDAGADLRVIAGNGVLLQASGVGIQRVAWADDPSLSCFSCFAPEARPKITTRYFITAYNEFGCAATDSMNVFVLCDGSQLSIPNTFTPNGDGLNDFFFPRGQGIDMIKSFRVYSRWGELLFDRKDVKVNDEYAGWNGTFNGRKLNPDVYVYIMEAICDTGEPIKFKGDVTIIR